MPTTDNPDFTGSMAVSGNLTIDTSGGPVEVDGSIDANITNATLDVTGGVVINNEPGVFPLTNLVNKINNFTAPAAGGNFSDTGYSTFNSLIVQTDLQHTGGAQPVSAFGKLQVQLRSPSVPTTVLLQDYLYYLQATAGVNGATMDDSTLTVIPLNGADEIDVTLTPPASGAMAVSIWGTNAIYAPSHRSTMQLKSPYLINTGGRINVTGVSSMMLPLPVTNNPVRLTLYSSGTGTGTPASTLTIVDSITNLLRSYVNTGIAKSTPPIVIELPNTLAPSYIQIDETVSGAISRWEILALEEKLPIAA